MASHDLNLGSDLTPGPDVKDAMNESLLWGGQRAHLLSLP